MASFAELTQSNKPLLVDFFATWCGPCNTLSPILKQTKDSLGDKITIVKVDVDKNPAAAQQYGVQGVPTLILFKKGEIKWRQSGVVPFATLTGIINRYLN